jgi:hypothetical protein
MRKQAWPIDPAQTGRAHCTGILRYGLTTVVLLTSGCEGDIQPTKQPQMRALEQTGVTIDNGENAQRSAQPSQPAKQAGPIVSQRTVDIRNAATEVQKGDAKAVQPRITARDYIALQGNAYVAIIGQTSVLAIQHAMDLYYATNDRYPKDYDEFMAEIIKANNIALPQLPTYQKYGYDEKEHKLVILEYQALKEGPAPR